MRSGEDAPLGEEGGGIGPIAAQKQELQEAKFELAVVYLVVKAECSGEMVEALEFPIKVDDLFSQWFHGKREVMNTPTMTVG